MTNRLRRGNLQVSETLANFIENEALTDTKISSDMFWEKLETILNQFVPRNKELLEQGVFKLRSFGTGKYGRVLGEVFVSPDFVGEHITECIANPESKIDLSSDGWVSVNDILMEEGHAYEYDGGKKKVFNG